MDDVEATLEDREGKYGSFEQVARTSQKLQNVIRAGHNFDKLSKAQRESLFMMCNKISRMVNGDPTYIDNAHDLVGYATLMLNDMVRKEESEDADIPSRSYSVQF